MGSEDMDFEVSADLKVAQLDDEYKLIRQFGKIDRVVSKSGVTFKIPFVEAAEIGTEKVIRDHSTIGIVVTTDGSIGEFNRSDYLDAEDRVIKELKSINKPFIVVLNTTHPTLPETERLAERCIQRRHHG